jgi:hypothetical protein
MTCYQSTNLPSGVTTTGRTSYTTEADCLNACKEGACCEGTACSVKPQCQCQGTGKVFKGVGTTCTAGLCCDVFSAGCAGPFLGFAPTTPSKISATISVDFDWEERYPYTASPQGTVTLDWSPLDGSGVVPFPTCAYYFGYDRRDKPSGVSINAAFYIMNTINGSVAAMAFIMLFDDRVTGFSSSGPCAAGTFIPASPCYSASATLYRETGNNSGGCNTAYERFGSVSVTG